MTGYNGQDVLCLDEFNSNELNSSWNIQFFNNLLDCYPLALPARYSNKQACYTKVAIIANIPIEQQFIYEQYKYYEIFKAFLRRINYTIQFFEDGSYEEKEFKGEIFYDR